MVSSKKLLRRTTIKFQDEDIFPKFKGIYTFVIYLDTNKVD